MTSPQEFQVPPAARDALARGELIAAIKLLRDANPRLDLRDAKRLVAQLSRDAVDGRRPDQDGGASFTGAGGRDWPAAVDDAIAGGRTIEAIKLLRDAVDLPLKDAKDAVERRAAALASGSPGGGHAPRPPSPSLQTVAPGDAGATGLLRVLPVLLVLALVAAVVWTLLTPSA